MWGNKLDVVRAQALALCLVAGAFLLTGVAAGQSTNDVHVAPLAGRVNGNLVRNPVPALPPAPVLRPRPLRHDVDLVLVPVTVTDRFDRLVTGLEQQDFRLLESDQPQPIRYFSVEDAPISLGVLVDVSASMRDKIDDAKQAAVEFFENSNPNDDYFVITFSDYPQVLADSTRSIAYIRERLATAEPKGYTSLLDAIYLGINKLQHARYARRALLIISDGGDNISRFTEDEIKRIVEESDVQIYSVGIYSKGVTLLLCPEERHGKALLTNISDATGGRMVELHNSRELPEIARQVSLELRSQYVLGYRPPAGARDGKWRKIQVSLAPAANTGGELRVYSKKGYLGPEQ